MDDGEDSPERLYKMVGDWVNTEGKAVEELACAGAGPTGVGDATTSCGGDARGYCEGGSRDRYSTKDDAHLEHN